MSPGIGPSAYLEGNVMFVYATSTCSVNWNGNVVRLSTGEKWAAEDPFVTARPEFFSETDPRPVNRSAPPSTSQPVERATRAPGEKRAVKRVR